jgi:cobalt transporter subunit CbtB
MTARGFSIGQSNSVGQSKLLAPSRAEILRAALLVFTLGAGLVYLAGFAYSDSVHNAAHDTRHSLAFPCH